MSNDQSVGRLHAELTADEQEFIDAFERSRAELIKFVEAAQAMLAKVGQTVRNIGIGLSAGVTLPFAAMVNSVEDGAGDFEAQMKRVESALLGIPADQLKDVSDQARELGPAVGKSATEAAAGIDALARAGMSTSDILSTGLKSALDLSAAGMTEVDTAAATLTDVMGQFQLQAKDLPGVVRSIVGALDASKFAMGDFVDALAQGGGVVAAGGLSFDNFAAGIAAVSSQFKSGSDAGTAFKTYMGTLIGQSKDAKRVMNELGISFYDVKGRILPLADQAEMLRKKFGELSDQDIATKMNPLFGQDAVRVAIGLLRQGRQGVEEMQAAIAKGDVSGKIAKNLEGSAAASKRIQIAWEAVKLRFGIDAGLLGLLTSLKNAFASLLESLSRIPVPVAKVIMVFGALAAAIGPLLLAGLALAPLFLFLLPRAFGIVGTAVSLIVSPMTTLARLLAERFGIQLAVSGLRMLGVGLLRVLGPIGLVVTAFLALRDYIEPVLRSLWRTIETTFGPRLFALWTRLQLLFAEVENGPIGKALDWLGRVFRAMIDVVGVFVAAFVDQFGKVLIRVIDAVITQFGALVGIIEGVVDTVTALLRGDWAGAWQAMGGTVDAFVKGWVDTLGALLPGIQAPLSAAYEAAKKFLVDNWEVIKRASLGIVGALVSGVTSIFPGIGSAAAQAYNAVKNFLFDKLGWLAKGIASIVDFISGKFQDLKKSLHLGGYSVLDPNSLLNPIDTGAPQKSWADRLSEAMAGTGQVPGAPPSIDGGKKGKAKSGPKRTEDDIRLEVELEAARARNDEARVRALEDQIRLKQQIKDYEEIGYSKAVATVKAGRDLEEIQKARAEEDQRALDRQQRALDLEIAEKNENWEQAKILRDQADLEDRINLLKAKGLTLDEATNRAKAQQRAVEDAEAQARARWLEEDALDRQIRRAELRGENEETIRGLRQQMDILQRANELQDRFRNSKTPMSRDSAIAQATAEAIEEEQDRLTGVFRDTFKSGVRAALDGNFSDWFENWWKDRLAKAMDKALNSVADAIAKIFSDAFQKGHGGGIGGWLGDLGKGFSSLFGGGGEGGGGDASAAAAQVGSFFGWANGGGGVIQGRGGIDKNMLAINGVPLARVSKGEVLKVGPQDQFNPRGMSFNMPISIDATGADAAALGRVRRELEMLRQEIPARAVTAVADYEARRKK